MKDIFDSPTMRAMRALQNSPTMRAARAFEESPTMRALRAFERSSALGVVREFEESPTMSALRAFEGSSAMGIVREFVDSPTLSALHAIQKSSTTRAALEYAESPSMKALQNSSIFQTILGFQNIPSESPAGGVAQQRFSYITNLDEESINLQKFITEQETQNEIIEEFHKSKDFNLLSDRAKKLFLYILHFIILPLFLNCLATAIITNTDIIQNELLGLKKPSQVKSLTRKPHVAVERALLKGYRVVTGDGLRLRRYPRINSKIITTLPMGKLINVIDSSNRKWLFVQVDNDGDLIEGWVSRTFTTYFK